jgi:hypothetical protein
MVLIKKEEAGYDFLWEKNESKRADQFTFVKESTVNGIFVVLQLPFLP